MRSAWHGTSPSAGSTRRSWPRSTIFTNGSTTAAFWLHNSGMQSRPVLSLLAALSMTACATQVANQMPEPNVVELLSVPPHAAVNLDCGAGTVAHGTTPMRVDVPRYPE